MADADMRGFHDGVDRHGELLAAIVALVDARAVFLAFELRDVLGAAAMSTHWTIRPADAL